MTEKEQTISNLKKLKSFHNGSYGADIDRAIKALEQKDAIEKIRAEVEDLRFGQPLRKLVVDECLKIIDKYREE